MGLETNRFDTATKAFEYYELMIKAKGLPFDNTKALFNESFVLTDPVNLNIATKHRKWSLNYANREWDWYKSGDRSIKKIKDYAPIWDKMHDGDELVWSNYGWWWQQNEQLSKIIKLIRDNPRTRRAIVVHYNPWLLDSFTHDTPCNVVLNFWVYCGKLNLTVFARSIDLWYGFCNDQFCFSRLMDQVASATELQLGEMHWFITNFHLYNDRL